MRRLTALIVLAGALDGACLGGAPPPPAPIPAPSPASPARSPSLDDLLAGDLAADRAFAWSEARRLTWSDFQGSPPGGGEESALTAYGLYYAWRCRGPAFGFRVIAAFRPRQSWVKTAVLGDSTQSGPVLQHEQTHFDLSEVYARRMRQYFAGLASACGKTDAELGAIAQRLVQEEKAEQRRYDAETRHGLAAGPQALWTAEVARRLAALARYAS
jgi:hypothetical protein